MRAMIRFGKQPRLRFISHLDLQRFFQRALNRTGLPIAWTQGFNPHPVMSFGSALALGWTSEYEIVDFKLAAPMGRKRVEDAMRASLPVDLPVLEARLVDDKHPAPMAMVRASDYRIEVLGDNRERILTRWMHLCAANRSWRFARPNPARRKWTFVRSRCRFVAQTAESTRGCS